MSVLKNKIISYFTLVCHFSYIYFVNERNTITSVNNHLHRKNGGGERDRTDDLLLAKQALYQLSYTPNFAKGGGPRRT